MSVTDSPVMRGLTYGIPIGKKGPDGEQIRLHPGRFLHARALLGRAVRGGKGMEPEDHALVSQITGASHAELPSIYKRLGKTHDKTYPFSRLLTNPIGKGLTDAATDSAIMAVAGSRPEDILSTAGRTAAMGGISARAARDIHSRALASRAQRGIGLSKTENRIIQVLRSAAQKPTTPPTV